MLFAQSQKHSSLCSQVAEPQKGDSSPTQLHNKRDTDISQYLFYGVVKVPQQEPFDRQIVPQKTDMHNRYHNLVSLLKQSTQEYYNMRMVLGLKVS